MAHSLKRVFFWLSGAGTETLEQCPNWEQRKYVAFGATVLVPCAFAFIACSYALSTLVDDPFIIYPVATVWALIILTIDRALVDGVEHSRAAREFLDSMIEMEKAFEERMRTEQEQAAQAGPERIAALQAMKTRFYDDLHHRMEVFFTIPPAPASGPEGQA